MSTKIPPCTKFSRHAWSFVRNRINTKATYAGSRTLVSTKKVGVYKCACGATKEGVSMFVPAGVDPLQDHLQAATTVIGTTEMTPTGSAN